MTKVKGGHSEEDLCRPKSEDAESLGFSVAGTTPANFFPVDVQHSSRLATSVTSASTFPCVASIPTGEIFNTVTDTSPRPKQASEESARAPIPCLAHISERRAEKEGADCSGAKGAR